MRHANLAAGRAPGRRHALALLAAVVLALAPLAAQARAPRALWVWEADARALLRDPATADEALAFAHRQGVGTFYLYAGAYEDGDPLPAEAPAWHALLRRLHAGGLRVQALLGSAPLRTEGWVLPERQGEALAALREVLDYNAAAARAERFDGVHLDIEPHQLPEWDHERERLLAGLLDLGQSLQALRAQRRARLPLAADLPFWLDGVELEWRGVRASAAAHAIRLFDSVTLMDYRNHAAGGDGIVAHALPNLALAARAGRPMVIGVETGEALPDKLTFRGLRREDLERELADAERALRGQRAFAGFAIHHYGAMRSWLAAQGGAPP